MVRQPDILERIIEPQRGGFSEEHARYVLSLDFASDEHARYAELASKAQEGSLSEDEQSEIDEFLAVNRAADRSPVQGTCLLEKAQFRRLTHPMNKAIEQEVRRHAAERCEYCHLPQSLTRLKFSIDHVQSKQHGGSNELENLALACGYCNRHKGPNVAGIDSDTGKITRLFHPRRQLDGALSLA